MLKRKPKSQMPEQRDPGENIEPCGPGSIEQQLDMCEQGDLKGDDILENARHGEEPPSDAEDEGEPNEEVGADQLTGRFRMDMSEPGREGDEMSGDEHSAGLQGDEPELEEQPHVGDGVPGEESRKVKRSSAA